MLEILESLTTGAMLLLVFLIWTHPKGANRLANRWLSAFLASIFLMMLDDLFNAADLYRRFSNLIGLDALATFFVPPAFYLSILHFVTPRRRWRPADLRHFVLFFFFLLLYVSFLTLDAATKIASYEQEQTDGITHPVVAVLLLLFFLQVFFYWVLSYRRLLRHQRAIRLIVSSEERVDLRWLQYFLLGFLIMLLMWTVTVFYESELILKVAQVFYFLGVFFLAYHAIRQGEVFAFSSDEQEVIREIIEASEKPEAARKKLLSDTELAEFKRRLDALMLSEKIYQDNELSLPRLADVMDTSTHILSYLLNEGYGENFFQLVNRHRVEMAKAMLADPDLADRNVLSIAYEAGFNSKTAFNTSFKTITGLSPTA
ncbi:MAG: helix-turn-helix transcriptional regulator, partial [Sinomicrobium sp.]|nr:helix-turn-helix transcriptional regulator [Sinomicrobium sp.]